MASLEFSYRSARSPAVTFTLVAVILIEAAAVHVRFTAGVYRDARRIAFRLDDAPAFLAALEERRAAVATRPA